MLRWILKYTSIIAWVMVLIHGLEGYQYVIAVVRGYDNLIDILIRKDIFFEGQRPWILTFMVAVLATFFFRVIKKTDASEEVAPETSDSNTDELDESVSDFMRQQKTDAPEEAAPEAADSETKD